jgi:hypothetical protein
LNTFTNSTLQQNITKINDISLKWVFGFLMSGSLSSTSYYVTDLINNKVYVLNDNWSYVSNKTFSNPALIITIECSLFMTGHNNIWKLDKDLNVLIHYNATASNPKYRGIYYDSKRSYIYVAPVNFQVIQEFDLKLTLRHNISTSPYKPCSLIEYNNQILVGTTNGIILFIVNEMIKKQINGCNERGVQISSILFDGYGYMATSCNDEQLYLYYSNGSFTGKNFTTPHAPRYIGYDSKERFVLISIYEIHIYN